MEPPKPPKARRWTGTLLKLGLIAACCAAVAYFVEPWIPRAMPSVKGYHAHMRWMSLQPALDLPEGHDYPIPVGNEVVDARTGTVLHTFDWLSSNVACLPVEEKPGTFQRELHHTKERLYEPPWQRIFDSTTPDFNDRPQIEIVPKASGDDTIARVADDGSEIWSTTVPGIGMPGYPSQTLITGDRIVVVRSEKLRDLYVQGLVALNRETGDTLWTANCANDSMCASNELLVAAGHRFAENGERAGEVTALHLSDGTESFRLQLSTNLSFARTAFVAGMILVTDTKFSLLLDDKGRELCRLEEEVIDDMPVGDDALLLTNHRLILLSRNGSMVWRSDVLSDLGMDGGSLQALPNGDLLVLMYPKLSARPERVARVSHTDGEVVWSATCGGFNTNHSAYWHRAYLDLRGDWLYVVGQGMHGHTITILDLETGDEERRWFYQFDPALR